MLAAVTSAPPSELHVYVVDGGGLPDELADLPHVGAVIARTDDERVARLVDRLGSRLDGRTADGAPPVLLVVDGLAAWRQVVAERLGGEVADRLDRVLVEGPAVGIVVAATVERPGALPLAVSGAVGERLVFRLGDPADALLLGLRPAVVADLPSGRAVVAGCGLDVQMAEVATCRERRARHRPLARGRPPAAGIAHRPIAGAGGHRAPAEAESWRRRPPWRGIADLVAADRPRRADPRRVPRGPAPG